MGSLVNALKALQVWQAAVLLMVLAVGFTGAYGAYVVLSSARQPRLADNQQLIPVTYGDLVNQVSTNGSLVFADRVMLTFGTQGTVGEVLVAEGQQVKEGQPLARLDAAAVATLERAVAQARVSLKNAEDALVKAKLSSTPLDLAQAEAKVADARLSLKKAQDALDALKEGPTTDDMAKAQSQVDSARTSLANTEGDLRLARKDWDSKLQTAQKTWDTAWQAYKAVFSKWLGISLKEKEGGLDPDTLLASWGVNLSTLFAPDLRFQDLAKGWAFSEGLPSDDPATPWSEPTVYTWLNFFPVGLAPTCESGMVAPQTACVKKEMADAWDGYQKAQDNLDTVQNQAAKAIASAESAVTRAKDSLAAAEEALVDLKEGADPLEVDVKAKQLVVAQATLAAAEADMANLKARAPLDLALRESDVTSAKATLDTALQRLEGAILKAPTAGTVSLVNVEVGQVVNANTPAIEIVDPGTVELDGVVDEVDVLFVREGAQADVTLDALPGQVLQGTVSSIASAARTQQGVVSYPIRISVQLPEGVELREGLSATASIVIREERNVILVPLQALYGTFEQAVVKVMNGGRVEERAVVLGNNDDYWVAVRQGLAEGEQVVMQAQVATAGQLGLGQAFRQFQGGVPGGGGQRGQDIQRAQPTPQRGR